MLGQLERPGLTVVADFEAGLGTVMRLVGRPLDIVVVVVEPTAKSLEVGQRAADLVRESGLGRLIIAANRVRDEDDTARVAAAFPRQVPFLIPDDPAILEAERHGQAPLDAAPQGPGVRALVMLAEALSVPADRPTADVGQPFHEP